jgi:hypothetical protein
MVIQAHDELRHPHDDHKQWRESMWFCFQVPEAELGCAIYFSYRPNADPPLASFSTYVLRGMADRPNAPHYLRELDLPIPDADWDDLSVGDIAHYRRTAPLHSYAISLRDGPRLNADLEFSFFAGAWHYADNTYETPKYIASDRYHRPFRVTGELELDGVRIPIDTTGDSDHSWGPRRWRPLFKSKYIAGQCGSDFAFQIMSAHAVDGGLFPYGYIWDGRAMSPITGAEIAADYGPVDGVQTGIVMNVIDRESRLTRIEGTSFCSYPGSFFDAVWNTDCYASFDVNRGRHTGSGILSFYWDRQYYRRVFGQ